MKHKILAVVVALVGFGAMAALPAASARTGNWATSHKCKPPLMKSGDSCVCPGSRTKVGDRCDCPPGVKHGMDYCECPKGTSFSKDYCEPVAPQGPPTVSDWKFWDAKNFYTTSPALKFTLLKGINGAPGLKQFTLILPDGLTFGSNTSLALITGLKSLKITAKTLTATLDPAQGSVLTYLKQHLLIESNFLRQQLHSGKIKFVTFVVDVTDANGKTTDLDFRAVPTS